MFSSSFDFSPGKVIIYTRSGLDKKAEGASAAAGTDGLQTNLLFSLVNQDVLARRLLVSASI